MSENVYMQAPLKEESDIKIFILYLMDKLDRPLDYADIHDVVVQNGLVSAFDFCMNFPDLIDSGHVRIENNGDCELYLITDMGREVAQNLNGNLLHGTKRKALANAELLLNLKKTKSDIKYYIEDLNDGRCRFHIKYRDNFEETLSISVVTENRMIAEKMHLDFESHPETFRRAIMTLLNDKVTFIPNENPLTGA